MGTLLGKLPDSGNGTANQQGSETTDVYLIRLDSFNQTIDAAILTPGVPSPFSFHPTIAFSRVRDYTLTRRGNSLLFELSVHYSTPDSNSGTTQENDDPTADIAVMRLSYEDREEVVQATKGSGRTALNGVRNSAGELFDPAPTLPSSSLVMEIRQNYTSSYAVLTTALNYMERINSDSFLGCAPHTCRIVSVSPKTKLRNGSPFLEITFVIKVRPTWDLQLLDIGSFYFDDDGNSVEFKTDDGNPYHGLLNGSGKKLASGASPVFLPDMQVKSSIAFSGLGLPSSLSGYKFE